MVCPCQHSAVGDGALVGEVGGRRGQVQLPPPLLGCLVLHVCARSFVAHLLRGDDVATVSSM